MVRPGALGDTLMLLPALHLLREGARVTFLGRRPGLDALRLAGIRALDIEQAPWCALFSDTPQPGALPVRSVDRVVAFFQNSRDLLKKNLEILLPGARVKVYPSQPEGPAHMVFHGARCLKDAGLPVSPKEAVALAREGGLFGPPSPVKTPSMVLHPGSGSARKNYPPAFFRAFLEAAAARPGLRDLEPLLLLGPAEEALRADLLSLDRRPFKDVLLSPDLGALTDLLRRVALFVGHDSGITHLAALCGAPTLALFRNGDSPRWGPLGPQVRILDGQAPPLMAPDALLEAAVGLLAPAF